MPERYFNVEEKSEKETLYLDSCISEQDSMQGRAIEGTHNLIEDLRRVKASGVVE